MKKLYKKEEISFLIIALMILSSFAGIAQGSFSSNGYCRIVDPDTGDVVSGTITIRIVSSPPKYNVYIDVQELNTGDYVQESLKASYITGDIFEYDWDTTALSDGAYAIKAGNTHGYVSAHVIVNINNIPGSPPSKPDISGPNNGCFNTGYTFTATSTDSDNPPDNIYYCWDYNKDHKIDEKLGPYSSGESCSNIVEFYDIGTNFVCVLAEDARDGSRSGWATHIIDIEACSGGKRVENGAGTWCTIGLGNIASYEIRLTEPPASGSVTVTVTSSNPSYVSVVDIGKKEEGNTINWGYSSAVFDSADDYYRVKLKGLKKTDSLPNGKVKVTWDADSPDYLDDIANIKVVGSGGGGGLGDHPTIPRAGGPYLGYVGESIEFDASGSENAESYRWDFDYQGYHDGYHFDTPWMDTPKVSHNYSSRGIYNVVLQVDSKRPGDLYSTNETMAFIHEPGDDWLFIDVNFTYSIPGLQPIYPDDDPEFKYLLVNFDANCQNLLHTGIKRYHWVFGDGTTSTQKNPEHIYAFPKSVPDDWVLGFNVKLTIFVNGINGSYDPIEYSKSVNKTVIVNPIDFPEINVIEYPIIETSFKAKIKGESIWQNVVKSNSGQTIEYKLEIKHVGDRYGTRYEQIGGNIFQYPQIRFLGTEYGYDQNLYLYLSGVGQISFNDVYIESGHENDLEISDPEYYRGNKFLGWGRGEGFNFDSDDEPIKIKIKLNPQTEGTTFNLYYKIGKNHQIYRFSTKITIFKKYIMPGSELATIWDNDIRPMFSIIPPGNQKDIDSVSVEFNGQTIDIVDAFIEAGEKPSSDSDADGIHNIYDNCPYVYNPGQEDSDGDGVGDACDEENYDPDINLAPPFDELYYIYNGYLKPGESMTVTFETTSTSIDIDREDKLTNYSQDWEMGVFAWIENGLVVEPEPRLCFIAWGINPDLDYSDYAFVGANQLDYKKINLKVSPVVVEKQIWNPLIQDWDEIAEFSPNDIVKFRCTVETPIIERDGASIVPEDYYFMKGAEFVDHLPYCLQYIETTKVEIRYFRGIDGGVDHSPPPMNPDYDIQINYDTISWTINNGFEKQVGIIPRQYEEDEILYEEIFNQIEIIFEAKVIGIGFNANKFGMDDFTLVRPGREPMPYPWSDRLPSYKTYEEIYDRAYPRVDGTPDPRMQVVLKAWDDYEGGWIEELYTVPVGTLVRFNITITNTGNIQLLDLKINNIFCSLFQFGDPSSARTSRDTIQLYYPSLIPGESFSYELEAELISQGQGTNRVDVNATIILPDPSCINLDGLPIKKGYIESGCGMEIIAVSRVPVISNPQPADGSSWVSINLPFVRVTIEDPEGDCFEWEISTYPDVGSVINHKDFNGVKTCNLGYLNLDATYTWIVKATDPESGFYSAKAFSFTTEEFTGPRPPYTYDDQASTEVDTSVTIDVLGNDQDDGTIDPSTVEITLIPSNGIITGIDSHTGRVTYMPDCGFEGVDTFKYTVKDDEGLTSNEATVTVYVGEVSIPPVAVDDSATTEKNVEVEIDVLANDYDPDGEIDRTTIAIVDYPTNGTIGEIDPSTMDILYIPNQDFTGVDSFTYTVLDDDGIVSNIATVQIYVTGSGQIHIEILKPASNTLYLRNKGVISFPVTLIFGAIDINASVIDPEMSISHVKFFIDDNLLEALDYNPSQTSYQVEWNTRAVGLKTVKVAAFASDTEIASQEIDVIAFIFPVKAV